MDQHPLALLNRLSNQDKHRAPNITTSYSRDTILEIRDEDAGVVHRLTLPQAIDPKTHVLFHDIPDTLKGGMQAKGHGKASIAFGEAGPLKHLLVDDVLGPALDLIEDTIVPSLKPFLG